VNTPPQNADPSDPTGAQYPVPPLPGQPGQPGPPGYPPTDPNAQAFYAQMAAYQRLASGPAATAMLTNARDNIKFQNRVVFRFLLPFIGCVYVGLFVFLLYSAFSSGDFFMLVPAIMLPLLVVLFVAAIRRAKRSQQASQNYIDEMIAMNEGRRNEPPAGTSQSQP
jgi:hypothetical protein